MRRGPAEERLAFWMGGAYLALSYLALVLLASEATRLSPKWLRVLNQLGLILLAVSFIGLCVNYGLYLWNWRVGRVRARRGQCVHCGYDLRTSSVRCPECGADLPPKDCEQLPAKADGPLGRGPLFALINVIVIAATLCQLLFISDWAIVVGAYSGYFLAAVLLVVWCFLYDTPVKRNNEQGRRAGHPRKDDPR